jgi:predicted CopG family antitoxin
MKAANKYMNIEGIEVAGKFTTIKVSTETRDELTKLGTMDDSYDSVIKKLIKHYKEVSQRFDRIAGVDG